MPNKKLQNIKIAERKHIKDVAKEDFFKKGREWFLSYAKDKEKVQKFLEAVDRLREKGVCVDEGEINWYISGLKDGERNLYDLESIGCDLDDDIEQVGRGRCVSFIHNYMDFDKFKAEHPRYNGGGLTFIICLLF